jgi:hypothetical protein
MEQKHDLAPGQIDDQRIRKAVGAGMVGVSPVTKGPKVYPKAVFQAAAAQMSLSAAHGQEMSTKDAVNNISAALVGTAFVGKGKGAAGSSAYIAHRLRKDHADTLKPDKRERTESSRWEWATYDSYEEWCDGWDAFALEKGYAINEPERDSTGKVIAKISFPPAKRRRIINLDEIEIPLDGSKRGRGHASNNVLINPALPRPGQKSTKTAGHITGVFMSNAAGEPGPVAIIDNSGATDAANRKIKAELLLGLPRLKVQFGHAAPTYIAEPVLASTGKGSMDTNLWPQYLEEAVYPLYPDLAPDNRACALVDGGPGRQHIPTLIDAAKRGLDFFPGFPNGSGWNQAQDQIYGPLKQAITTKADSIETKRRALGVDPTLTKKDLGELLNGKPGEPVEERPFDLSHSQEGIISAWEAVGAVPSTRNALVNNPKLRREGDAQSSDPMARAQGQQAEAHAVALKRCDELGLNTIPVADVPKGKGKKKTTFSVGPSTEEGQVQRIIESRGVSAGSMFIAVGAQAMNGAVALRGLVKRAQAEAQKERTESAKKKADSLALRDRAQEILAQGKADDSLSDSELADLLKWKLGPRGGISKLGTKAKKLEKWREVKDGPDADDEEEEDAEPLPYEGELDFLLADAQTPRVSAPGDGGPATAVGTAATAQNFGVEGMNLAELNALVALASAQKARLSK